MACGTHVLWKEGTVHNRGRAKGYAGSFPVTETAPEDIKQYFPYLMHKIIISRNNRGEKADIKVH